MKFFCSTCRREHDLAELSFGAEAPEPWDLATDEERRNSELTPDQCILETSDGLHYFVRACLDLPIRGADDTFTWGVWVSLSETSFAEVAETWDDPKRTERGPYFGWLCTRLPGYPDTMYLKTHVHQRAVGLRPTVELEPTDHPLAVQQRNGIDRGQLQLLVAAMLHP